jgi:hypothetical protein
MAAAATTLALGCTQQQGTPSVVVEDRSYSVTPDTMTVKTGFMTGQVTGIKVTERVEQGSGSVVSPAKLTGKLVLRNTSSDQTARLITGTLRFVDADGKPIAADAKRAAPTFKFASSYGAADRLDPGEEVTQAVDVDFPVEALQANKLKTIHLDLVYLPSSYRQESVDMAVSIGK